MENEFFTILFKKAYQQMIFFGIPRTSSFKNSICFGKLYCFIQKVSVTTHFLANIPPPSSVIMKVWLNKKKSLFRLKTTLDKKWPFKHSFNETKSENLGNYSYYINTFPSESLIVELYIYILLHRALKFQKSQE